MGRPRKEDVEQLELIDVTPENSKKILRHARAYLKTKDECHELAEECKKRLNTLRDTVKEAGLQPLEGGIIRVQCGDSIIELIPQSEKVKIKSAGGSDGADEGDEE